MQHHLHLQVVDCGKEGLHSAALPVSLPHLPTNSISTKEEEEFAKYDKKSTLSKEKLELTNMASKNQGPMETSWSLSLSPWRVTLLFNLELFSAARNTSAILSCQDSEGNCKTSPVVIGLNLLSVSEQLNFDEDFKVKISDSQHNLKFEKIPPAAFKLEFK